MSVPNFVPIYPGAKVKVSGSLKSWGQRIPVQNLMAVLAVVLEIL